MAFNWLAFWIAIAGILSNVVLQVVNARSQRKLKQLELKAQLDSKKYEVTFLEKRRTYVELMGVLHATGEAAGTRGLPFYEQQRRFADTVHAVLVAAYALEPFLDAQTRDWLKGVIAEFKSKTDAIRESKIEDIQTRLQSYAAWIHETVRPYLYPRLFEAAL